jgi:hypothetical protein
MNSQSNGIGVQGYIAFPRQKLSDSKKTETWFKENVDYAENLLTHDTVLRNSFKNKRTNYNLRANIINPKDFERYINPDKIDLESLPASFQHVGLGNNKINLLIGEYIQRKKEHRAYISSNDVDGITRKETDLINQIKSELTQIITSTSISEEEIQKRLQKLQYWQTYEYQDIAEIVANKILEKEYIEGNFDFTFMRTFEDLLVAGEQICYCGVTGRNPIMRRVNPMNYYSLGGRGMFMEDSDIQVEYGYESVGKVIDDYYDELTEDDINFLETGTSFGVDKSTLGVGLNRDISVYDYYGEENALKIFAPNDLATRTFAGAFDTYGNVRLVKVCWRSRRKIGERTYFDPETGEEQKDYVPETYKANKDLGETVKWLWVNEWMEATKIADHIYVCMRPIPYAGKSLTNKSKGTSPYIGSVNSTNDYKVQSLVDIGKPLDYSYDIAYYKRELAIATYKGSFAALNSSMVPSGWEPKEWMRYVTINKFGWFDPTNEILKGPAQGKSAGGLMNTLTANNVQIGDPNEIQMYTNLLVDIENTLGKLMGITGGREGQIESREAVNNVEREIQQTSHITEKWFAIDANFRKRVLTKFLECCKYAYKKYPQKGQFLLDDMGQYIITSMDEFLSSEMDIHIANSSDDVKLYRDLQVWGQAALQNGQATVGDLMEASRTKSTQDVARKLQNAAIRIKEENDKLAKEKMASDERIAQIEAQEKQAEREFNASENEKDRQIKLMDIELKRELGHLKEIAADGRATIDTDTDDNDNGVGDFLDLRKVDIDENYKNAQIDLANRKLKEQERSNKAKESIARNKPTTKSSN